MLTSSGGTDMHRLRELLLALASCLCLHFATPTDCLAQSLPRYRTIVESDLRGKSSYQLRVMRSEIYARHGLSFSTTQLRTHFINQPWYHPDTTSVTKVETRFSSTERYNVSFIQRYEHSLRVETTVSLKTGKRSIAAKPPRSLVMDRYPTEQAVEGDQTVYITSSSKKYHRESCRYLKKSGISTKLSIAVSEGYSACLVCRPPTHSVTPSRVPDIPGHTERTAAHAAPDSSREVGETVYITRAGHKYHRAGCRYLGRNSIPISLKDATAQGYVACSACGR